MNKKRKILPEDIISGNVVDFYEDGLRTTVVERVHSTKRSKKTTIFPRENEYGLKYNKFAFVKITEVYQYNDDGKLEKKKLLSDLDDLFE